MPPFVVRWEVRVQVDRSARVVGRGTQPCPQLKSSRYAVVLALGFAVLSGAYIVLSGYLAAEASPDKDQLRRIETIKGIGYVTVTSLLIFFGARHVMRRMEHDAAELRRREQALVVNEGRIFAGLTAASIAHDANNMLTVAMADVELLALRLPADANLQRLQQAVQRLIALNRRLLESSLQVVSKERSRVDVAAAAREALAMLRPHRSVRGCRVDFDGEPALAVAGSPAVLNQMVGNLVLNAAEATDGKGRIEVRVRRDGGHAVLEVHDDGPGVPPERRPELFTSLATTKPEGHGLGLFSVKACAQGLGGDVEVGDSPLGGARFRVRLPLA